MEPTSTAIHNRQALGMLSADDLVDDSGEEDELPADDSAPTEAQVPLSQRALTPPDALQKDGTRAVTPAAAAAMRGGAGARGNDDNGGHAGADRAQPQQVAQQQQQHQRAMPEVNGESSDEGAFASSESADKEVVQSQKQRLKRIAQIASIKRYKIDRVLGRGGMATVYYATDTKTGQPCALKLMEPHLADDAVFVERFKREIRASISLNHENIVRVFDYGEENGTYYMASEYVDGGTVASLLKSVDRPLPVALVVPIMRGFLSGLEAAHAQGFVHRDLKPANLMLTRSGIIKIGDFGIAKAQTDTTLTKTGALFGTPAYMSPEQAQGQELDTRSDLFGVGIIFYELLAGYNPFAHENPSTTMFAIAKGNVRALFDANPNVPEAVEKVVHKLLEKDLKKRYQSAGQARDELAAINDLVHDKFPEAVEACIAGGVDAVEALMKQQSTLESDRATKLLGRNPPEHAEAAFRYYKATLLDAENYDAVNGLTQLRADYGFRFTRPEDKQMLELEQSLEKKPDQPAVLRRLADLSATHRNLVDMAGFMKRYLRFFPNDTHVQHKLERIMGNDPLAPFTILAVQPSSQTAAWSASDEMNNAARIAADDNEATATPGSGGGKSGVRPAAKVGGASGMRPASAGATPSTATPPVSADSSNPGSKRAQQQQQQQQQQQEQQQQQQALAVASENQPPARDSFEAVLRAVRGLVEDTVRSLTGDQGLQAVKESLKDRLGEGGGDLKGVVKGALGKGKEAVAEGLLKEEGREAIKQGVVGTVKQHWRLAAVIIGAWVLLIGLGKACSLACGSSSAPAPEPPKKVEMRGMDIDDGIDHAPPAKKGAATPAPAAGKKEAPKPEAKVEATKPAMSAEEEARLLGDNKASSSAAAAPDAKAQLAARQDELKQRAKSEPDPKKAIDIYTQAIDTDPYAPGARDALLERARLYRAYGNVDAAEQDLFRLKRRPDVAPIQSDIDAMFAEINKAKKAQAAPE